MAQTNSLERVARIVDTLTPLGSMTAGRPLRSDDWNTVVAGVLDLARMALAREETIGESLKTSFAPREHAHLGQIDRTWLDAETNDLLDRGAANPELRAEVRALSDAVTALRGDIEGMRADLGRLQTRVDNLEDQGSESGRSVKKVSDRLDGLRDVQTTVAGLEGRFGALGGKVNDALAFRDTLIGPNGQPIKVADVAARLTDLETVRDSLRGADGKVVRYRDFERRLAELEQSTVRPDALDQALVRELARPEIMSAVSEGVLTLARDESAQRFDALASDIAGLRAADQAEQVTAGAQAAALAAQAARLDEASAQLARVPALGATVDGLTARVHGVEGQLQAQGASLAGLAQLPSQVAGLDGRLGKLEPLAGHVRDIDSELARLGTATARIPTLEARVDSLANLQPRLDALAPRVANLELATSANSSEVKQLNNRVTVVESMNDDAVRRVGALETNVSKMGTTLSTMAVDPGARTAIAGSTVATGTTVAQPRTTSPALGTGLVIK